MSEFLQLWNTNGVMKVLRVHVARISWSIDRIDIWSMTYSFKNDGVTLVLIGFKKIRWFCINQKLDCDDYF